MEPEERLTAPQPPQGIIYASGRAPAAISDGARAWTTYDTVHVVYLVLSIVEVLVGLRAALKLLAANPEAGFSRLLYAVTTPLVLPFRGVFPDTHGHKSVLELSSLLALAIYPIVTWIAVRLIQIARKNEPSLRY